MIGSTLASIGSSLWGGKKASDEQAKANALLKAEKDANEAWYNRRYYEDYSQTAEAQNMIRLAREEAEKQFKRAQGAAVVAGATDESVALAKENANKMIADTAANIAAQGTARKDAIEAQYMQNKSALTQQQMAAHQGKAQAISQAAGGASSAFGSVAGGLLSSGGEELFKKLWK